MMMNAAAAVYLLGTVPTINYLLLFGTLLTLSSTTYLEVSTYYKHLLLPIYAMDLLLLLRMMMMMQQQQLARCWHACMGHDQLSCCCCLELTIAQ